MDADDFGTVVWLSILPVVSQSCSALIDADPILPLIVGASDTICAIAFLLSLDPPGTVERVLLANARRGDALFEDQGSAIHIPPFHRTQAYTIDIFIEGLARAPSVD